MESVDSSHLWKTDVLCRFAETQRRGGSLNDLPVVGGVPGGQGFGHSFLLRRKGRWTMSP